MGKKWIILLFLLLVNNAIASEILTGEVITGETVTGKAIGDNAGVSVRVVGRPFIIIERPENKTYLINKVLTNYTSFGSPDNVTYSVDGGANITLFGETYINYSDGQRFLELFANNAYGSAGDSVYFKVDTSLLKINYTDYNGSSKGDSTDFYDYAYEDLLALNGTVLEDTYYGKIEFNEMINVENDSNSGDGWVYINRNVKFSQDYLMVDPIDLPNFNVSSTISLYGITFSNPQILKDGSVCPVTICTELFYGGGTYTFGVTETGTFLVRETPQVTTPPSGGGGGGGGGTHYKLDLIPPGPVDIASNDHIIVPIIVRNAERSTIFRNIKLNAETTQVGIFPSFEDITIRELRPGQEQTVMLFVKSINADLGNFEIELIADVGSPSFRATETLYMKTVESVGKVEVLERILLAQELFRENPECLELGDLLIQAQNLLDAGNVESSRTLVQEAILRCRELVSNKEYANPTNFGRFDTWRTPVEIALILIIITLIIFSLFRRRSLNLQQARGSKRDGFFKKLFKRKAKRRAAKRRSATRAQKIEPITID